MYASKWILSVIIVSGFISGTSIHAKVIADSRNTAKQLTTIGDALNAPDHHPIHVLYVHGIDEIGSGDSATFRNSICTKLNLCNVADWKNAGVEFPDKGEFAPGAQPPSLQYLGNPIWNNADEWAASAPFVVHWVVHLRNHPSVLVVDELNWWPLIMALKCRRIVAAEPRMAGPSKDLLQVCSEASRQNPDGLGHFYPWIAPDQAKQLAAIKPRGALVNRTLKGTLVDWGLADVVLVVGPLGGILRDGLRQLMSESAAFDPNGPASPADDARERYDWHTQWQRGNTPGYKIDQEFVGITHSLGSYLLFNTLSLLPAGVAERGLTDPESARNANEDRALEYIFERTSLLYFFANQLQMLEVTNLEYGSGTQTNAMQPVQSSAIPSAATAPIANFRALVHRWQVIQSGFEAGTHPNDESARKTIQVVAWSDPSDVLTWRVPRIGDVDVINLFVQNAPHWFWLLETPTKAHSGYACNKDVLHYMFRTTRPEKEH